MALSVRVPSNTKPGVFYYVHPKLGTCTCPAFKMHKHCRHLAEFGVGIPEIPVSTSLSPTARVITKEEKKLMAEYDKYTRTRLSQNFILRDFLFSTEADILGVSNRPSDDPELVIRAGKALCAKVLEPVLAKFGKFAITFGYQTREVIEADMKAPFSPRSSCPHQWDRGTFFKEIYARVDIMPFCVEDGHVNREDFAMWMMKNLDIDLCMLWWKASVFCITISPKPRRVCLEWVPNGKGDGGGNSKTLMGEYYWQAVWPTLPPEKRPVFGPSETGGRMRWSW